MSDDIEKDLERGRAIKAALESKLNTKFAEMVGESAKENPFQVLLSVRTHNISIHTSEINQKAINLVQDVRNQLRNQPGFSAYMAGVSYSDLDRLEEVVNAL